MIEEITKTNFQEIIKNVVDNIQRTQLEIFQNANQSILDLYFYIGSIIENNIKWGNKFIDNLSIELKNKRFIPEYAGKMNYYLSALDDTIKTEYDNPSIGIILVRNKNKLNVEYALRGINKPIGVSSYELSQYLPADIIKELPTEEDLNLHIDINE